MGYWFYNKAEDTYSEGKGTLQLVYSDPFLSCLKTLHQDELIELFGVPNYIGNNILYYQKFIDPARKQKFYPPCMSIKVDEDGKFIMLFFDA